MMELPIKLGQRHRADGEGYENVAEVSCPALKGGYAPFRQVSACSQCSAYAGVSFIHLRCNYDEAERDGADSH